MTQWLKLVILATVVLGILDFTSAASIPVLEYDQILGTRHQAQDGDSLLVRRQANSETTISSTTVIIVCVVVIGGYFLILAAIIGTLIFCFVRFSCDGTCSAKCTRKARLSCPKLVDDNVNACCTATCKYCSPCCSNPDNWDSGELGFWIEVVILAVLCFPFAFCLLILWAIATK